MNLLLEMGKEALLQGLVFSFVVMGCYLTSRVIRCDDLSVEGSFGLGGATAACALLLGVPAEWTLFVGLFSGALVGLATALLHTRLGMNHLIAGIVTATAVYSVNLKIAGANVSILGKRSLFDCADGWLRTLGWSGNQSTSSLLFLIALALAVFAIIRAFLRTEMGLLFRSVGCNPSLLSSFGREANRYKTALFSLSNALAGMAGALFVQLTSFFSLTGSMGTLAVGLTGLILGELFSRSFALSLIIGAILCQSFFAASILLGIDPMWNYLLKSLLIVLFMQIRSPSLQRSS